MDITALMRRVRIRSFNDLLIYIILLIVVVGLQYFLPKFFPTWSENTIKIVTWIVGIVIAVICFFIAG